MTDEVNAFPTLQESKLYELSRRKQLLDFLVPDIATQMTVELEIEDTFKREAIDKNHTRILVNYSNLKGKSLLYKLVDAERLDRRFGIDGFMDGFMKQIQKEDQQVDVSIEAINATVLAALNVAVSTVLGINDQEGLTKNTEEVSKVILQSLTSILFNDALDVMIAVQEKPLSQGQTIPEAIIVAMWIVKQRPADMGQVDVNEDGNWVVN